VRLCLVASKPTDSVSYGILPAAARLGLAVVLLTAQPQEPEKARARAREAPRPGCPPHDHPGHQAGTATQVLPCDVWDPQRLITAIAALPAPDAIFSNSDHLQVQTALAAAYLGLPGKDWRASVRARNKSLMRRRLSEAGVEHVASAEIRPGEVPVAPGLAYPLVLKPATGVASEDVMLVRDPGELARQAARVLARRPGALLLAEEYLPGGLRTVETVADGETTWVLGGFRTTLCPPPFFIEERLTWDAPAPPAAGREHVTHALGALGATFGACHTEYVLEGGHRPALIEVNDRLIGDTCDFVLSDLLGVDLFERVLRVHLGERLPPRPPQPPPERAHAVIDYVVADRPGALRAAPQAGPQPSPEPGVRVSYWPLRATGDRVAVTHTNRDYLGVITAIGPDLAGVERCVAGLRAGGGWEITEPGR
jgi:biotin carboxylase